MAEQDFTVGQRVRATRGVRDPHAIETRVEVGAVVEAAGGGVAVRFEDGAAETFREIEGYVSGVPKGAAPERDENGYFTPRQATQDAAAGQEVRA